MRINEFRRCGITVVFVLLMIAVIAVPSFCAVSGSLLTIQNNGVELQNCLTPAWTVDQLVPPAQKTVANGGVVNFPIIVTKGESTNNILKIIANLRLVNTGDQNATIGNVVVDLQQLLNDNGVLHWESISNDAADATIGDAAVMAKTSFGIFKQNTASKFLEFMDVTNTIVFLNPQQIIVPQQTVDMRICAQFSNNVLARAIGSKVRAQIFISYGNAADANGFNIDINGNGVIDPDEANVRSKYILSTLTVPVTIATDDEVMLTGPFMSVSNPLSFWNFNNGGIGTGVTMGSGDPAGTIYNFNVSLNADANPVNALLFNRVKLDSVVPFGSIHKKADENVWVGSVPTAAPSNLVATSGGPGEINLAWIDNSSNELNFILERSTTSSFTVKTKINIPANTTSFTDTGLAPGTYYYRIAATNAFGSSAKSNPASAIAP